MLPGPIADYVEALAECTQTPPEMAATLVLGVLATVFQARFNIAVTPDWQENLNLYTVAIAPPGERKSPVIAALTAPLYAYQKDRVQREAVTVRQNKSRRAIKEKQLADAEKEGNTVSAMTLAEDLANFEDIHTYQLMADDVTPEKLEDILYRQQGCITIASAEGGVFDALSGRYNNFNISTYLKAHCGDPITVQRMGREGLQIDNPRLSLILTIQPQVLHTFTNNDMFRGRGLCARFLYAVCNSKVGKRKSNPAPMPGNIKATYEMFIQNLLKQVHTGTITVSPDADATRTRYQDFIENRLQNEWYHVQEWGNKLVGTMMRIAALIHCTETTGNPANTPLHKDSVMRACALTEHLACYTLAAYQSMGADETVEAAKYMLGRIIESGRTELTGKELSDLCRGRFKYAKSMQPPLEKLVEMGYLQKELRPKSGAGRPSKIFLVNPSINTINTINSVNS